MAGFSVTLFLFLNMFNNVNCRIFTDLGLNLQVSKSHSVNGIDQHIHTVLYVELDHRNGFFWSVRLKATHGVSINHIMIGKDGLIYMVGIFSGRLMVDEGVFFSSRPRTYVAAFSEDSRCLSLEIGEVGFPQVSMVVLSEFSDNFENYEIIETVDPIEPSDPIDPTPPPGGLVPIKPVSLKYMGSCPICHSSSSL